ncbi:hypothetical protein [Nocardia sp. NPDC051750]|uniref:hypothetical protein n=1 Tax=Nocardia sp. NPDC051750 TaxID=3364325 RepID=UPI0037A72946
MAGVIAAYLAVRPANSRHFYTDDTEAQYAPLWVVMAGRSLWEGRFALTWRPPGWKIGGATPVAGLLGLVLLQVAYRRGRRCRIPPVQPGAGKPDLVAVRS